MKHGWVKIVVDGSIRWPDLANALEREGFALVFKDASLKGPIAIVRKEDAPKHFGEHKP